MSNFVTYMDYVQLYYEDRGEGQPIVFVHGWSGTGRHFRDVTNILMGNYRCISYDHRGHGVSAKTDRGLTIEKLAQDLFELIEYLKLEDVILVGHSMGASTVYSYLRQFGCRHLSKVVFVDMSPKFMNEKDETLGLKGSPYTIDDLMRDIEIMNDDMDKFIFDFYKNLFPSFANIPDELKEVLEFKTTMRVNDALTLKSLWFSMAYADFRDVFDKLTVPALYVAPEDGLYSSEIGEFIAEHAAAKVDVVTVPNSKHLLPVGQPAVFAEVLQNWLTSAEEK